MPSTPTGPHALTEFGTPFAVRNLTGNGTHLYFERSDRPTGPLPGAWQGKGGRARTSRGGPGRG
jgi:hypothetical protein